MRRFFQVGLLSLIAAGSVVAGDFSETDRHQLLSELARTREALLSELRGLSPAQARFQPAEDKWAAIHVLEHIVLAEERIQQLISAMLQGEPTPGVTPGASDEKVATFVIDRSQRFNAPGAIQPTGKYASLEEGIQAFEAVRQRSIDLVKSTDQNLRAYLAQNQVLGQLDGYQWVTFLSGHCQRHTLQIKEIKESPSYPES